jgi:hypothetical protein
VRAEEAPVKLKSMETEIGKSLCDTESTGELPPWLEPLKLKSIETSTESARSDVPNVDSPTEGPAPDDTAL